MDNFKKTIEESIREFFEKATIPLDRLEVDVLEKEKKIIKANVKVEEPQILIGEKGKTLDKIQKLLAKVLNKKTGERLFLNLDVNNYKEKKMDYLKDVAREAADEVAFLGEEKVLPPMSSFERRVVHMELSDHPNVVTESRGEDSERRLVIKPS